MISIRSMTVEDIPTSQEELLLQLVYLLDEEELGRRYASVSGTRDHALFVAEDGGRIVALCHRLVRIS
jgi:hypothetical protein